MSIGWLDGVSVVEEELSLAVSTGDGLEAGLRGPSGEIAGVEEGGTFSGLFGGFSGFADPNTDLGVVDGVSVLEVVDGESEGLQSELVSSGESSSRSSGGSSG